jgi:hypothetical protein
LNNLFRPLCTHNCSQLLCTALYRTEHCLIHSQAFIGTSSSLKILLCSWATEFSLQPRGLSNILSVATGARRPDDAICRHPTPETIYSIKYIQKSNTLLISVYFHIIFLIKFMGFDEVVVVNCVHLIGDCIQITRKR